MDNLRTILKTLYFDMPYDFCEKNIFEFHKILRAYICNVMDAFEYNLSNTEHSVMGDYAFDLIKHNGYIKGVNSSLFNPLLVFANRVLFENEKVPVVKYNDLLKWHETTSFLGEDIFTTSYLACKDLSKSGYVRNDFDWSLICPHNNGPLNAILKRGLSELHFHLKGSSANVELNWLCLMNHVSNRGVAFDKLNKLLSEQKQIKRGSKSLDLQDLCIKAAFIRFYFYVSSKKYYGLANKIKVLFKKKYYDPFDYEQLDNMISAVKLFEGWSIDKIDYASNLLKGNKYRRYDKISNEQKENSFIRGERKFMYDLFRKFYSGAFIYKSVEEKMFYTYLLAKSKFSSEFIQINKNIGFKNFSDFETRKEYFTDDYPEYSDKLKCYAIKGTLSKCEVDYLEVRISPQDSVKNLCKKIKECGIEQNDSCFIILHFIKMPSKKKEDLYIKNNNLREKIKTQAFTLVSFMDLHKTLAKKIVGVDAANSEFGCRPEVFGQVYRYLKMYDVQHFTYHVGEDFYDITDGLRAIDEAINFLNLRSGDRIGHALALGIDPEIYYKDHRNTIISNKQNQLDNMVWALCVVSRYNINMEMELKSFLEMKIDSLAHEIGYNKYHFSVLNYFSSMLLRGDDPMSYLKENKKGLPITRSWVMAALNDNAFVRDARKKGDDVVSLYKAYHQDKTIRKNGEMFCEIKFPNSYIYFVKSLQDKMISEITYLNIGIECNPTSNIRIRGLKRYDKHPIFRFYNSGIVQEGKQENTLSVSINTDDLGIFSTSLPREYSIIVASMEKMKDVSGKSLYNKSQISQWIENVRLSANEQRFVKEK